MKLDGNISTLNLKKLGFYADPLNISGEINADFAHLNPDDLNGSLHLKNFKISARCFYVSYKNVSQMALF